MSAKHTPGPWSWAQIGGAWDVMGKPTWPCRYNGKDGRWRVATLDDMLDQHPAEVEANARLIAAAPELAEALQDCLDYCMRDWTSDDPRAVAARAALAKAGVQ